MTLIFPYILGIFSSQLTNIFGRGRYTTNQIMNHVLKLRFLTLLIDHWCEWQLPIFPAGAPGARLEMHETAWWRNCGEAGGFQGVMVNQNQLKSIGFWMILIYRYTNPCSIRIHIFIFIYQLIGLREKQIQENPIFHGTSMVSCRFSLKSTHWIYKCLVDCGAARGGNLRGQNRQTKPMLQVQRLGRIQY